MKRLIALLLAAMMLFAIVACADDTPDAPAGGGAQDGFVPPFDVSGTTIVYAVEDAPDLEFIAAFEEWSGATLDWQFLGEDDYENVFLAMIMAGTPPDVIWMYESMAGRLDSREFFMPLTDLINYDDTDFWGQLGQQPIGLYDGVRYTAPYAAQSWFHMFYNTGLFENEGMETPTQLLDRGAWTWEQMFDIARHFTRDTTGDGVNDMVGLTADWTGFVPMMMMTTLNTSYVTRDADGRFVNNVNDPTITGMMNTIYDAVSVHGIMPDGDNLEMFMAGNAAMFIGGAWYGSNETFSSLLQSRAIAMVPSPTPCGTIDGLRFGDTTFMGIPRGAANPEGAAVLIYFMREQARQAELPPDEDNTLILQGFTPREVSYFTLPNLMLYYDQFIPGIWDLVSDSFWQVMNGEEWSTIREWLNPQIQLLVDNLNAQ